MNSSVVLFWVLLLNAVCAKGLSQHVTLSVKIKDESSRRIVPAMVCITNLQTGKVHIPPDGDTAAAPTFPAPFYSGIDYSHEKNWIGPVRKMSGPGAVNGQRTYVYGNNPSVPGWTEPVMYQTSGNFIIKLTKGKWRIAVRRGMEYIPVYHELHVTGNKKNLQREFLMKRWVDLPARGWYSGDVHAHHALDKENNWEYLFSLAEAEDVHMVNMLVMGDRSSTHFNTNRYGGDARRQRGNICLSIGQEEPRSDHGHIIGLNIDTLARDTSAYNHYDIVFDKIHQSPEASVGFAHFAYRGEGVTKGMAYYMPASRIDFVELLQNTQINYNDYYDYLDLGFHLTAAAGSDFPWGSTIGDGRVYVYTGKTFTPEAWFKGFKAGNTFVSNGPVLLFTASGALPGSKLGRNKGDTIELSAESFCHPAVGKLEKLQLVNSDGLLAEIKTPEDGSFRINMKFVVQKSQWIVARALCENGAVAHTSPIYVHVDGKNHLNREKVDKLVKQQTELLDAVVKDERSKPQPDEGVLLRVERARKYYEGLVHNASE